MYQTCIHRIIMIYRFTSTHFDGELIHDLKKHVSSIVNGTGYNLFCRGQSKFIISHGIVFYCFFYSTVGGSDLMLTTATEFSVAIQDALLGVEGYVKLIADKTFRQIR